MKKFYVIPFEFEKITDRDVITCLIEYKLNVDETLMMFADDIDNFYNSNCTCESVATCNCEETALAKFEEKEVTLTKFKDEHLGYLKAVIPNDIFELLDEGWNIEHLADRCNGTTIVLTDD